MLHNNIWYIIICINTVNQGGAESVREKFKINLLFLAICDDKSESYIRINNNNKSTIFTSTPGPVPYNEKQKQKHICNKTSLKMTAQWPETSADNGNNNEKTNEKPLFPILLNIINT